MHSPFLTTFLLASTLALPLQAQGAGAASSGLPDGRSLIDAHVAAIGGRDAALAPTDGSTTATLEIVESGITGSVAQHTRGQDTLVVLDMTGIGQVRSGRKGDVVWTVDPVGGARLIEDKERQQWGQDYDPRYQIRDPSLVVSATTTALSDSEGRACFRVEIRWASGDTTVDCYSSADGLRLSVGSVLSTPMGAMESTTHLYDYALFGKLRAPRLAKLKSAGMTVVTRIETYREGAHDPALFELPAAIQALLR